MSHQGSLRACFDEAREKEPDLQDFAVLGWTVDVEGHVIDAQVVNSSFESPVEACLVTELQHWAFPASDATTTVARYPFKFGVGK